MRWLKGRGSFELKTYAVLILIAVTLASVLGGLSLRNLSSSYSMDQFMPADHPLYASDTRIRKAFRLSEEEPLIVYFKLSPGQPGTWLEPARMKTIEEATEQLAKVDGIKHVTSVANVEAVVSGKQGIKFDRLLSLVPQKSWLSRVRSDTLLSPGLVSADGRVVTLIGDMDNVPEDKLDDIITDARFRMGTIARRADAQAPVTGMAALEADMTRLISKEMQNFLILAFLACLVTLLAYFRSFSTVVICLLLVVVANVATLATMVLAHVPFSVLSTTLPVLASITALAIGSHTLLVFGDNWKVAVSAHGDAADKPTVIFETFRMLLLPNFLMALTTVVGFATLMNSQVPLISQFSKSVTFGILTAWAAISLALPPLMLLLPVPVARSWTGAKARWALWVIRRRRLILFLTLALTSLIVANGVRLNWAVRLYDDLPKAGGIQASFEYIDKNLGGIIPLELMIKIPGEANPWNEPARIAKLDHLLAKWRSDPSVGSAIGLPSFLKYNVSPVTSRKSIAETIFLFSMGGEDNPLNQFLSTDASATRLSLRMRDVPSDRMKAFIDMATSDAKSAFPGAEVNLGGMANLAHPLNAELSTDLIWGLWQSLLWISLLLVVVFRSLRLAIVAAVPNLLAPFVLLATMGVFHTPIKPVVAIIFSIALGIAYNNTVYLVSRMRTLEHRFDLAGDVIMRTWYKEGNPCLFSSLALFGGFAVFLASYFSLNRTFGAYMLWSIGVGLLGDLVVLPALLRMFPWLLFSGAAPAMALANPKPPADPSRNA